MKALTSTMVVRASLLVGAIVASRAAAAGTCPPSAAVSGDPALVDAVGEVLLLRGVAKAADGCTPVNVRLVRRGDAIAVVRTDQPAEERIVVEIDTAATLIESWSRSDFEEPLMISIQPIAPKIIATRASDDLRHESMERVATPSVPPYLAPRGIQVFAAVESSFADDRSSWAGVMVGVCIQVGAICVSARGRVATLVAGGETWNETDRHAADFLFGGDIPLAVRVTTLSIGFAAGMGAVNTHTFASGMERGTETFGLRADAHAMWSLRLGHRVSVELSTSIGVAQVTDVESSLMTDPGNEPRLFARLGAGLRLGGR